MPNSRAAIQVNLWWLMKNRHYAQNPSFRFAQSVVCLTYQTLCVRYCFLGRLPKYEHSSGYPGSARSEQNRRYQEAASQFGPALERLVRAYESDASILDDLLQEIHLAVWRSFAGYDGRCSIRTWVYRVAHNTPPTNTLRFLMFSRELA